MRLVAWSFSLLALLVGTAAPILMAIMGWQLSSPPRLVLYGLLPGLVALCALVAMWLGDTARKMFLVYGLAVAAAVGGAEVLLSFETYASLQAVRVAAPNAAAPIDRGAVIDGNATRAYPQICGAHFLQLGPPLFEPDGTPVQPVAGLSRNLLGLEDAGGAAWHTSDQYGFNNPPGQWDAPPVPVLVVGDSFAFGIDVPIGRGFVDRVRERLGKTVNIGCEGNGPLLELASLVEYGPLARPRIVLWAYYEGNDLTADFGVELGSPVLMRYLSPGFTQNLAGRQAELDRAIAIYLDAMVAKRSGRSQAAPHAPDFGMGILKLENLRTALGLDHRLSAAALSGFQDVLRRAQAVVVGWGGRLVLVYLPGKSRYVTLLGEWDAEAYGRRVRMMADNLRIPVIDMAAVFARQPNPSSLIRKHYTEQGYALVADTIVDRLDRLR